MSTCVGLVVGGGYERYLPHFMWFLSRVYPDYGLRVVTTPRDRVSAEIRASVPVDHDYRFVVDPISELPLKGQPLKTLRWLLDELVFEPYENAYIGDVDILLCPEERGIEAVHISHCEANGLPYSNCLRPRQERLSGLHFIRRRPYYEAVGGLLKDYRRRLLAGAFGKQRNEEVLYHLMVESGIGLPKEENRIDWEGSGPHHGVHTGLWRVRRPNPDPMDSFFYAYYMGYFDYFLSCSHTTDYQSVCTRFPLLEIPSMVATAQRLFKESRRG